MISHKNSWPELSLKRQNRNLYTKFDPWDLVFIVHLNEFALDLLTLILAILFIRPTQGQLSPADVMDLEAVAVPVACQPPWPWHRIGHLECVWQRCPVLSDYFLFIQILIKYFLNSLPPCHVPPVARVHANRAEVMCRLSPRWRRALVASYSSALKHRPLIRLISLIATELSSPPHKTAGILSCCFPKPRTDRPPRGTELVNQ